MRLRTANNHKKAAIRRQLGHELWPPPKWRHAYRRDWKRFERNAEGIFLGGYAFGCRGHPGQIIELNWDRSSPHGSDCAIRSLIDGVEESCSIFHCGPQAISKEHAEAFAEYAGRHGRTMATMRFDPESWEYVRDQYNDPAIAESEYRKGKTLQQYLDMTDAEFEAYETKVFPE